MSEFLYRYDEKVYESYRLPIIELTQFKILKRTPKGVWIQHHYYKYDRKKDDFIHKRFILLTARKQFACETKEKALESFKCRKRKQRLILEAKLQSIHAALVVAESMDPNEEKPVNQFDFLNLSLR